MADSNSPLDLLVGLREPVANALFQALSPALIYARRESKCGGLRWAYYGGRFNSIPISGGYLTLTANSTNYITASLANGSVSVATNTTAWDDAEVAFRLYSVVTNANSAVSWQDHRG